MRSALTIASRRWAITTRVTPLELMGEAVADDALGHVVKGAGRLVEQEDPGPADDRPGDQEPLTLAAGEVAAPLPDQGVHPHGHRADVVLEAGQPGGLPGVVDAEVGAKPTMLLKMSLGMSCGMLEHDADLPAHLAQVERGQLAAVVGDGPRVGRLESEQEPHQRRLSRARRRRRSPRTPRAGPGGSRRRAPSTLVLPRIAERDAIQGQRPGQPDRFDHGRGELGLSSRIGLIRSTEREQVEQADRRVADGQDRRHQVGEGDVEGEEAPRLQSARVEVDGADVDHHGGQDRKDGQPLMDPRWRAVATGSRSRSRSA